MLFRSYGCNEQVKVGEALNVTLQEGRNVFYFIPEEDGDYSFSLTDELDEYVNYYMELCTDETDCFSYCGYDNFMISWAEKDKYCLWAIEVEQEVDVRLFIEQEEAITSIEILQKPTKTVYDKNDNVNNVELAGIKYKVTYESGKTEVVTGWDSLSDGRNIVCIDWEINWTEEGTYPVILRCGNVETSFDIKVVSREEYLETLEELTESNVLKKYLGSDNSIFEFKFTPSEDGIYYLNATYVQSGYVYEYWIYINGGEYDSMSLGDHNPRMVELKANVTYVFEMYPRGNAKEVAFEIQRESSVESIKLVSDANKNVYRVLKNNENGIVDYTGLRFLITYDNQITEVVPYNGMTKFGKWFEYDESKIDWNTPGVYTVTFNLDDAIYNYEIRILSEDQYIDTLPKLEVDVVEDVTVDDGVIEFTYTPEESSIYRMAVYSMQWNKLFSNIKVVCKEADFSRDEWNRVMFAYLEADQKYHIQISSSDENVNLDSSVDIVFSRIEQKEIKEISIANKPMNNLFEVIKKGAEDEGELLWQYVYECLGGLNIKVEYADGTVEYINTNGYWQLSDGRAFNINMNNVNWYMPGTYPVTMSLGDFTISLDVRIVAKEDYYESLPEMTCKSESIEVFDYAEVKYRFMPEETGCYRIFTYGDVYIENYNTQEILSLEKCYGNTNKINYFVNLNKDCEYIVGFYPYDVGTFEFEIEKVSDVQNIRIVNLPEQTEYTKTGTWINTLDFKGLLVEIQYEDGVKELLNFDGYGRDGRYLRYSYNLIENTDEEYEIEIMYGDKYDTFTIKLDDNDE